MATDGYKLDVVIMKCWESSESRSTKFQADRSLVQGVNSRSKFQKKVIAVFHHSTIEFTDIK